MDRLFPHYQSTLGVTELSNSAERGETSGSLRTGGQLDSALADINAASDTRAVTIDIGGNDALSLRVPRHLGLLPFRYNFFATLSDLRRGADSDPGPESFAAMAYYNPASGLGGEGRPCSEPFADRGLLGTDLAIAPRLRREPGSASRRHLPGGGAPGGARRGPLRRLRGGRAVLHGQPHHPNDAGHAAIAAVFREASPVCPEAGEPPLPNRLPRTTSASAR